MAVDLKYGQVEVPGIPADEPVFIIRAKDETAIDAIQDYFDNYQALAPDAKSYDEEKAREFVATGNDVLRAFGQWQDDNRDSVKLPD